MMKKRRKDITWEEILKQLTDDGIEKTPNYKEDYLRKMEELCQEILHLSTKEDLKPLKSLLYDLASMFYLFDGRMKYYNEQAKENHMPDVIYEWCDIPGNHNFNAYLKYLDRDILEQYYLKMVSVIMEYIKNRAEKLPKKIYYITSHIVEGQRVFETIEGKLVVKRVPKNNPDQFVLEYLF